MSTDALGIARSSRAAPWRVVVVVASLLLNVLLIGVVAGHLLTPRHVAFRPNVLVPGAHLRALPVEERRRFSAAMAGHRAAIHAARVVQHGARLAVEADIGAPTLDIEKMKADFVALREANGALQAAVNDGLVDALGSLSSTSRASLVSHREP